GAGRAGRTDASGRRRGGRAADPGPPRPLPPREFGPWHDWPKEVGSPMSAVAGKPTSARPADTGTVNWIIDRRTDLCLLIGPAAIGYLFLFLNAGLGVSSFLIWWFWEVSLNGPHFFATISRTYLDRQEWRERGALLLGSLLWLGVGPLALMADEDFD